MPGFCHTSGLNEVPPLDKSLRSPTLRLAQSRGTMGGWWSMVLAAALPSLRISNSQIFRQVLPMPLFSSAFMEMAGRFSCHRTMPKQAGMSNSIKSTGLRQVGPGPVEEGEGGGREEGEEKGGGWWWGVGGWRGSSFRCSYFILFIFYSGL